MTAQLSASNRDDVHALVDALPESELSDARRMLGALNESDPVLRASQLAPLDDEPFTDDEREDVEAAEAAYRRGEWVSGDDVRREIGW